MNNNKNNFLDWMKDGNTVLFNNGYGTQCHQYKNRVKGIKNLYKFYLKEFVYI